jgi:hypothetical protein
MWLLQWLRRYGGRHGRKVSFRKRRSSSILAKTKVYCHKRFNVVEVARLRRGVVLRVFCQEHRDMINRWREHTPYPEEYGVCRGQRCASMRSTEE